VEPHEYLHGTWITFANVFSGVFVGVTGREVFSSEKDKKLSP